MKNSADSLIFVDKESGYKCGKSGVYNAKKLQIRNKYMVDKSDILLAIWNGDKSGTKNCIDYAEQIGKSIDYILLEKNNGKINIKGGRNESME